VQWWSRRPTLFEFLDGSMARARWCATRMKRRTNRKTKLEEECPLPYMLAQETQCVCLHLSN
jgi:hypothetical protein